MKESKKPFFYRIEAADLVAEVLQIPDGNHKEWITQFALDLVAGIGTTRYSKKVIAEVAEYQTRQAENGRKRWKDKTKREERVAKRALATLEGGKASHEGRIGRSSNNNNNRNNKPLVAGAKKLAWILATKITERNPDAVGLRTNDERIEKAVNWAKDMDLLLRVDKVEFAEAERVLLWCQSDTFWADNILSGAKFRKQFTQLQLKSKITPKPTPKVYDPKEIIF